MITTTKQYGNEVSWSLGTCPNAQTYESNNVYTQQCCTGAGDFTLSCKDSYGDGWNGGYLEINGVKYCDDFSSGSEKTATVTIAGDSSGYSC